MTALQRLAKKLERKYADERVLTDRPVKHPEARRLQLKEVLSTLRQRL